MLRVAYASCMLQLHVATCKLQAALLQTRCKVSEYCVLGVSMRTVSPGKALCMLPLHVVAQVSCCIKHVARYTLHVDAKVLCCIKHVARYTLHVDAPVLCCTLHVARCSWQGWSGLTCTTHVGTFALRSSGTRPTKSTWSSYLSRTHEYSQGTEQYSQE
jgi:hypothetical protein